MNPLSLLVGIGPNAHVGNKPHMGTEIFHSSSQERSRECWQNTIPHRSTYMYIFVNKYAYTNVNVFSLTTFLTFSFLSLYYKNILYGTYNIQNTVLIDCLCY